MDQVLCNWLALIVCYPATKDHMNSEILESTLVVSNVDASTENAVFYRGFEDGGEIYVSTMQNQTAAVALE